MLLARRRLRLYGSAHSQGLPECRLRTYNAAGATALEQKPSAQLFSVWSFNLRTELCGEQDGVDGWSYRAGGCAALIKQHSPAVLCVQEATKPMLDSLCGRLGYQWYGECRSGTGADEHSALLWDPARLRLLRGETSWLSPTPEVASSVGWDAQYPRIYTRGLFELVGRGADAGSNAPAALPTRLVIMSTHFDHVGHSARLHSASLLRSLMRSAATDEWQQAVGHPGVPTILCGDFNSVKSTEEGSAYHTLTSAAVDTYGEFEDAWVMCPPGRRSWNGLAKDGSTIHKFQGYCSSPLQPHNHRAYYIVPATTALNASAHGVSADCSNCVTLVHRLEFKEVKGDGTVDLRFQNSGESAEAAAHRTAGSANHIDWVLMHHPEACRTQLTVETVAVITDKVKSSSRSVATQRYPSDHYPIAVEFRVEASA